MKGNTTQAKAGENFKKAFDELVRYSLDSIERNWGEHIYFETNPADPTLPHIMHDVNTAQLREFIWLKHWFGSCILEHTEGARMLTKGEAEKIISIAIPISQSWSETHKKIICSFIPCPCCEKISMIIEVSCQGRSLGKHDEIKVSGWYRMDISAMKGGKFEIETYRLNFEKEPLSKQVVEI